MPRLNIGMLTIQEQKAIKDTLIENNNEVIGQLVEDDLIQAERHQQEIEIIRHVMNNAEEVIHEAEDERQALERGAENAISLESLQRTIKSFECRTGVAFKRITLESRQDLERNTSSIKMATESIIDYVKKLIKMLMNALISVWDKVKGFFKNLFSGAEKLRKRAEKIKAKSEGSDSEKPRKSSAIINGKYTPSAFLETQVEGGGIIGIRNALIMELNSLITDSDTLRAGLKYVLNKKPEVAEKYTEGPWSRGMDDDKDKWDKDYYMRQEVYLDYRFSKERYLHMIEVREYLRNKGIDGFVRSDKKETSNQNTKNSSKKSSNDKITLPAVLEFAVLNGKTIEGTSFVSQYEKQTSNKNEYRETINEYVNRISSGDYADVLEATKKDNNKDEITKLIKNTIVSPGSNAKIIKDSNDGIVEYTNSNVPHLLGDYYQVLINFNKDATWEQISKEYAKISFDLISEKRKGIAEEVEPLSRKGSNTIASAVISAMENFKKLEEQQKKLGAGFNKLMTEAKRLEKDENISAEQLRVATGFIRASVNAVMKMSVTVSAYELRLSKAALDYAGASLNINSAA